MARMIYLVCFNWREVTLIFQTAFCVFFSLLFIFFPIAISLALTTGSEKHHPPPPAQGEAGKQQKHNGKIGGKSQGGIEIRHRGGFQKDVLEPPQARGVCMQISISVI